MGGKPWDKFDPTWGPSEKLLLVPPSVEAQLEADWKVLQGQDPEDELHIAHMSEARLKEFVLGVLDGSLYTSQDVREEKLIPIVFMPIALGALKDFSEEKLKEVGGLYARMSTAFPRSINGHPMFWEVGLVHRDDWARAWKAIHRERTRRTEMEV